jgi:hypothetical protein
VTPKNRVVLVLLLIGIQCFMMSCAGLTQTRGGAVTIHVTALSPIIALLAGILILIMPRLLNYVVAIYLILVGLIGIFGL